MHRLDHVHVRSPIPSLPLFLTLTYKPLPPPIPSSCITVEGIVPTLVGNQPELRLRYRQYSLEPSSPPQTTDCLIPPPCVPLPQQEKADNWSRYNGAFKTMVRRHMCFHTETLFTIITVDCRCSKTTLPTSSVSGVLIFSDFHSTQNIRRAHHPHRITKPDIAIPTLRSPRTHLIRLVLFS